MSLKIIETEDGSQSLFDDDLNETYHSTRGAKGESEYVFLQQGLDAYLQAHGKAEAIHVLEVGFGTGLNAWLTWLWAEERKQPLYYQTLEPKPVPREVLKEMKLASDIRYNLIHEAEWNRKVKMSERFAIEKKSLPLEELKEERHFQVIFFDAFAPSKQKEIWSQVNLESCYRSLTSGGILTTYCAQGQFKRDLEEAGFEVEVLPGALGKKEMVRGHRLA